MKRNVVIGFLGTKLDGGTRVDRWNRWRPTVNLCQQADFVVDRLELLTEPNYKRVAEQVRDDIALISPETTVNIVDMPIDNPWDLEEVYGALFDFADLYNWQPGTERYLMHITTGTHVAQICQFLLTEARFIPGEILQLSPPRRHEAPSMPGRISIIDLDLSRYDQLANRFAARTRADEDSLTDGLDTRNPRYRRTLADVTRVATLSRDAVLLTGPHGAGKSGLARRIHDLRRRRHLAEGEFVEVSAEALGHEALEAIFGRRRGGGFAARDGLLKTARGGTLFLDDIEALPREAQARLSAWAGDSHYRPVGSDTLEHARVQLIAGSTLALPDISEHLRPDLFARLTQWHFTLPPLSERREDLPDQIRAQLLRQSAQLGRKVTFNAEALRAYMDGLDAKHAALPGNFHDLNASLSRLSLMAEGARITVADVQAETQRLKSLATDTETDTLTQILGDRVEEIDPFDRPQLTYVIEICRQSRSAAEAGRRLFTVSRKARETRNDSDRVTKYLARFGLHFAEVKAG